LAQSPDRGLGPVLHADLAQDRFDMDLHGRFSDVIASRDVLVRVASDDALQDVALPVRKRAAWLRLRTGHVEALMQLALVSETQGDVAAAERLRARARRVAGVASATGRAD